MLADIIQNYYYYYYYFITVHNVNVVIKAPEHSTTRKQGRLSKLTWGGYLKLTRRRMMALIQLARFISNWRGILNH